MKPLRQTYWLGLIFVSLLNPNGASGDSLTKQFRIEINFKTSREPTTAEEQSTIDQRPHLKPVFIPSYNVNNLPPPLNDNQVLLLPDHHGTLGPIYALWHFMTRDGLEWLGIEMYSSELQPVIDEYLREPRDSEAFKKAELKLHTHVVVKWQGHWGALITLKTDPYLGALSRAKNRGIKVFAMDPQEYAPGDSLRIDALGVAVRNRRWVSNLPRNGKGLIFGGALHFLARNNTNVQNFLAARGQTNLIAYDAGLASTLKSASNEGFDVVVQKITCVNFF